MQTQRDVLIARARSAVDAPITYSMRHGGGSASDALPGAVVDGVRYCDCTQFIAWVYGYERGGLNTDGIIRDAAGPQTRWRKVGRPEVGGIAVFGGLFGPDGKRIKPGHVYVITEAPRLYRFAHLRGIHCSASAPAGRAIQETATKALGLAVAGGRKWCWATLV